MIEEVERVIKGFEDYQQACKDALLTNHLATRQVGWERVAAICAENARAWEALGKFYRGEDGK